VQILKTKSTQTNQEPAEDRPFPPLQTFLAAVQLDENYPELMSRLPEADQLRLRKGDPKVWSDLIARDPELFREPVFVGMEDLAFEHLLRRKPSEDSAEPPSSDSSSPSVA
jgi:hypothetical protein